MTTTTLNRTAPTLRPRTAAEHRTPHPASTATPAQAARHKAAESEAARWKRLRWGVRVTLVLGVAASVAANMLHALPNPISQTIAAWPPLALLLTVELISRVPVYRRSLTAVRLFATTVIAGIAAWVSYWHMAGVAARYGETGASPYLLPMSVDGLVVVASVCLVELSGRIHTPAPDMPTTPPSADKTVAPVLPGPTSAPHLPAENPPKPVAVARVPGPGESPDTVPTANNSSAEDTPAPVSARDPGESGAVQPPTTGDDTVETRDTAADEPAATPPAADTSHGAETAAVPQRSDVTPDTPDGPVDRPQPDAAEDDVIPNDTAAAVAYWRRRDPNMHPNDIAARVGKSTRQVRRYLKPATQGDQRPAEGVRRKDFPADT